MDKRVSEGAEEVGEERGIDAGDREAAPRKPVGRFDYGGLCGGDVEVEEEKEEGEEKWNGFGSH
ncbi:hypothetical protein TIFTF001_033150 [Ficus carica]|uniref:Uncharacterized protein n=1 Tax=Ficus carica TaxID=3494 RepID=A0AA88DXW7_FICCA|nr:hypothetical protein TIFTF001_033150 [Ficus carica]